MAQTADLGMLRIHVVEAKLTRNTELLGKMDPYLVIETRTGKPRTRTLDGAGKTPAWNQIFDIEVQSGSDNIKFTVYDEDPCKSDLVGSASMPISRLCIDAGFDEWFPIEYKNKQSGQIHLKGTWKPAAVGERATQVPTQTT